MAEICQTSPSGEMAATGGILKISTNKCDVQHGPRRGRFAENLSLDFRPVETLILVILRLFSPLGPKIQEMGHLQHLKWPMAVRRPFIPNLYGVSGVLV